MRTAKRIPELLGLAQSEDERVLAAAA